MRWTLRISFLLFLAWAVFMVSPFLALYDLAKAVETKDLVRISERVNFHALRTSLSRQILGTYLDQQEFDSLDRQLATGAGTALLNPVVEELVTPQALADLLQNGFSRQAIGSSDGAASPIKIDFTSAADAWRVFISSEAQGFRSITIPLPAGGAKQKQFRLTLRFSGLTWRLTGIELPRALREELMKRASKATK